VTAPNSHGCGRAATGGSADDALDALAFHRDSRGDTGEAIVLLRAAADVSPRSVGYCTTLAMLLSDEGRCPEAAAALHEARRRAERYGISQAAKRRLTDIERRVAGCKPP